jgi:hypothetical protein
LIPDFIAILGYLDDLIIVPLGTALVVRMIPPDLMARHRELADTALERPVSMSAALLITAIWLAAAMALIWVVLAPAWGR